MREPKYKRVLLKISGEALAGDAHRGLDFAVIGGAIAAANGADFLCYVTPAEHLALPNLEDVKQGIMASKIAAHAADIAKGVRGAREIDDKMAEENWTGKHSGNVPWIRKQPNVCGMSASRSMMIPAPCVVNSVQYEA